MGFLLLLQNKLWINFTSSQKQSQLSSDQSIGLERSRINQIVLFSVELTLKKKIFCFLTANISTLKVSSKQFICERKPQLHVHNLIWRNYCMSLELKLHCFPNWSTWLLIVGFGRLHHLLGRKARDFCVPGSSFHCLDHEKEGKFCSSSFSDNLYLKLGHRKNCQVVS